MLDGCHKIGRSAAPSRRLEAVSPSSPVPLRVVCFLETEDMARLERYLHVAFHHRRACGEWFRLTDEEVALVGSVRRADGEEDLPPAIVAMHHWNRNGTAPAPAASRPRSFSAHPAPPRKGGELSRVLLELADAMGLTRAELARRSGLPHDTISHYFTGRSEPKLTHARKLCRGLGITLADLERELGPLPAD